MQVKAIYDQGRLEFIRPIQLKHERLTLLVDVPDDAIVTNIPDVLPTYDLNEFPEEVRHEFVKLQAMRDEVLNVLALQSEPAEETQDQKERWQAIEFRNSLRREQGRTV